METASSPRVADPQPYSEGTVDGDVEVRDAYAGGDRDASSAGGASKSASSTPVPHSRHAANDPKSRLQAGGVKRSGPGRKSRACAECKKQKMKCEVLPGDHSCRNCLRRSIACAIQRAEVPEILRKESERSALPPETYERKLDEMHSEIQEMKSSLNALLRLGTGPAGLPTHSLQQLQTARNGVSFETPQNTTSPATTILSSREDNMRMAMTRENSLEPVTNTDSSHGPVTVEDPMGSLYEVTRLRNIRSNKAKIGRPPREMLDELDDFISRGVISETEAEELYRNFHTSLNHYLWVGLEQTHPSFESVRKSSELLTATILTVTALHIPTSAETFDKCYKEFLTLISSSMFSRYHSIDDVRALCIAAFWLSEVSWKLSGHAIRIATELNIHQSFARALEGDREHFLRARLWYMLYVCDHHFSIAYGRPPMIAESQQIREHETFLASPFADALDSRICSQVNLMQILTRIYDRFSERKLSAHSDGLGVGMLAEGDFAELRNFNLEIDQWRMKWHARQASNRFIGTFPPKGIILYSYFAKLQLNSLAVRGVSLSQGRLSTERKEFANMAISAAASILTFVLEEADLRRALVGTPLYVHTMIAFASVFLMKLATKWNRIIGLNIETGYVSHLLKRMIILLKSSITSDRHLLHHIAAGLESMLERMPVMSNVASSAASAKAGGEEYPQESSHSYPSGEVNMGNTANGHILPHPIVGMGQDMSGPFEHSPGWESLAGTLSGQDVFADVPIMNDNMIYEAFGTESSANDVYNLLTSQFSY